MHKEPSWKSVFFNDWLLYDEKLERSRETVFGERKISKSVENVRASSTAGPRRPSWRTGSCSGRIEKRTGMMKCFFLLGSIVWIWEATHVDVLVLVVRVALHAAVALKRFHLFRVNFPS